MHPLPAEAIGDLLADGPVVTVCEAYSGNPLEVGMMRLLLRSGRTQGFAAIDIRQSFPKIVANHDTLREQGGVSAAAIVEAVRRLVL